MPFDRAIRSNAPSSSSRYSRPSALTQAPSFNVIVPKPRIRDLVSRKMSNPKIRQSPSFDGDMSPCSRPCTSATHYPLLPLTFHWRCCLPGCRANNAVLTSTHFTHLCHINAPGDKRSRMPSYRLSRCTECEHRACDWCLLLRVQGESEWRASDSENDHIGVW